VRALFYFLVNKHSK